MRDRRMIVGITGPLGGGRTAAAEYLGEQDFKVISLSGLLREEARRRDMPNPSIQQLQDLGDELRKDGDLAVLCRMAMAAPATSDVVIDGIKNAGEVRYLEHTYPGHFHLLAVDASRETRQRRKVGPGAGRMTAGEFELADARDQGSPDALGVLAETGQQVDKCVHLADFVVWNDAMPLRGGTTATAQDGTVGALHRKLDRMLQAIRQPDRFHPSDREVFMAQAVVASRRSECMQRKVGAVVAVAGEEGRILATGRNDAPDGLKSCRDLKGQCHRRAVRDEQQEEIMAHFSCRSCGGGLDERIRCRKCGQDHSQAFRRFRNMDLCRAVHAEERALLQLTRWDHAAAGELHLYTTTFPCPLCAKKIVQSRVNTVFYIDPYPGQESYDTLRDAGVRVEHFEGFTLGGIEKVWGEV
jgi:deoxycytidylate deaminase/dephospho-CoA kinase